MRGTLSMLAVAVLVAAAPGPAVGQGAIAPPANSPSDPTALDLASVQKLEEQLQAAGFDPGPIDGKADERTLTAVRQYQSVRGLRPTGRLDAETQAALLAEQKGVDVGGVPGRERARPPAPRRP